MDRSVDTQSRSSPTTAEVYATRITYMNLSLHTIEKLTAFLSASSCGRVTPDEVTIGDLMLSAFDLADMQPYYKGGRYPLFSSRAQAKIVNVLQKDYRINYYAERENFLANHRGIKTFIAKIDTLPNKNRYKILYHLNDYNATVSKLLVADEDFRRIPGVGCVATTTILQICKNDGVDFDEFRNH